ncbi:alpha/beta fold hydrolase BchO [Algirhabdus cladophorae]|uniref:alpha/beta fold hydrolase BchO n=1 Tax=Algirhabdus cladophorae TaxID=3377108 RepID=UPI003B84A92F
MRWGKQPRDWPNAMYSRQVICPPHKWHVQEIGTGPTLLLLHGAGGSTHSWRDILPALAEDYHVVAIDLPGQGMTQLGARQRCGLEAMAADIEKLMAHEGWQPSAIIGHSAGVAIALELARPHGDTPLKIIGINAALGNFKGLAGVVFPVIAKVLAISPFVSNMFAAANGSEASVQRLISGTGSDIDAEGRKHYSRLVSDKEHVNGTLSMMAQWSLDGLLARLPQIFNQTLFIVGDRDKAVPPDTSEKAAQKMPKAQVTVLPGLGHLAHEEEPQKITQLIKDFLAV